jgi:hypothetical protein
MRKLLLVFLLLIIAPSALAYIGPGAGISFFGSLLNTLLILLLSLLAILVWPARYLWKWMRRRRRLRKSNDPA